MTETIDIKVKDITYKCRIKFTHHWQVETEKRLSKINIPWASAHGITRELAIERIIGILEIMSEYNKKA